MYVDNEQLSYFQVLSGPFIVSQRFLPEFNASKMIALILNIWSYLKASHQQYVFVSSSSPAYSALSSVAPMPELGVELVAQRTKFVFVTIKDYAHELGPKLLTLLIL